MFHVDPQTGAWTWVREGPPHRPGLGLRQMVTSTTLKGRPFVLAYNDDRPRNESSKPHGYCLFDVTKPLAPRLAGRLPLQDIPYVDVRFAQGGDLVIPVSEKLQFRIIPFKGLDGQNNPVFDFAAPRVVGPEKDPSSRGLQHKGGVTADLATGDLYYLAVTAQHNKMVPAWGASGTGVGRSRADGTPLWFTLSSGGNYMSISSVRDGHGLWVLAAKDFGGQPELFDADGLRLATGNWGWPANYQCGFVDLRDGLQTFLRPDGKPAAYVEDDGIGRFLRYHLDGTDTVRRTAVSLNWTPTSAQAGPAPLPDRAGSWENRLNLPRVAELPVNGDWARWEKAGVVPQIVCLPSVAWGRSWPADLMQTFRAGTAVGALAHDGKNLYAYFLVADDSMHFDDPSGSRMWEFDSIELWLEEEQIGLGFRKDGRPALFKYRFHDRAGKEWAANYPLSEGNVWGKVLPSLAEHPLSRVLAGATGASFEGRSGYALMARIPMDEVRLVGGIADRKSTDILPMTGRPGEVLRVGVAIDGISYWGREQDYKVYWPCGLMFSDPTRSVPFVLGR